MRGVRGRPSSSVTPLGSTPQKLSSRITGLSDPHRAPTHTRTHTPTPTRTHTPTHPQVHTPTYPWPHQCIGIPTLTNFFLVRYLPPHCLRRDDGDQGYREPGMQGVRGSKAQGTRVRGEGQGTRGSREAQGDWGTGDQGHRGGFRETGRLLST